MRLSDARIGYAGYSPDFSGPGDRRRFCAYAAHRGLRFEPARIDQDYDLVLATHNGDLAGWTARKRREGDKFKFIFELVDGYFAQRALPRRLLKGTARFFLGTDSRLSPDFLKTLIRASSAADAVICSTPDQREVISRYNPNVFVSFDHFGDELDAPKVDYERGDKLRIVWEGQSTTVPNLQVIREPLNDLRDRIELHVVTDPLIYRYFGRFSPYPSRDALRGIECAKVFHHWDKATFARHIVACDLAVIPIERSNALAWAKPENKLVLLWQLGMPVLTSATPAYGRAMAAAGLDLVCADPAEWGDKLEAMTRAQPTELAALGKAGMEYSRSAYSQEEFDRRFDAAFQAAGFTIG